MTRPLTLALALLALLGAGPVAAQPAPAKPEETNPQIVRIKQLNAEARQAFDSYSFRGAQRKLEEALDLALVNRLQAHAALAETHLLAGITQISGFNDMYRGLHYFVLALRLDPAVQIPQALATPQLLEIFGKAKEALQAVGKPPTLKLGGREQAASPGESDQARPATLGLVHTAVDTAKRNLPVPLKAEPGIDVQAHKILLYFRPQGVVEFQMLPMTKVEGSFRAAIPASATQGRYLHYYIEALDQRGRRSASHGSSRSPNVVTIN